MPCGCQKAKVQPSEFVYATPTETTVYPTRVQAEAARVRDSRAGKPVGVVTPKE